MGATRKRPQDMTNDELEARLREIIRIRDDLRRRTAAPRDVSVFLRIRPDPTNRRK